MSDIWIASQPINTFVFLMHDGGITYDLIIK